MKNKKAAMEMSIGTIVVIVLAMSMLILGIVLVRNIFGSGMNVVDATDAQVMDQISKLFGDDTKVVIYPTTGETSVQIGQTGGFAFGIKNLITGSQGQNAIFSYDVKVQDPGNCEVSPQEIESWIIAKSGTDIPIPVGESFSQKILLQVPETAYLCTFLLRVEIKQNSQNYGIGTMYISVVP